MLFQAAPPTARRAIDMDETPSPSRILQTAMAFMPAKTLLSAVELDLFTAIASRPSTGSELCATLGLHQRATPDFFDALVALGVLERDGNGVNAVYRNSEDAATFLDRTSPRYAGGLLNMINARLFSFWGNLTEALRTGSPQNESKHGRAGTFDAIYSDPKRLCEFLDAMSVITSTNAEAFATRFDFSRYGTLCDVGGATGRLSIVVATRHPHVRCITTDLPAVTDIAREHVARSGLDGRIEARAVDFRSESLPHADVLTMSMILHDWNLDDKMRLIQAAHEALPPGGALVAIESFIDDERRTNLIGLMSSLTMLLEFGDAFDFTTGDFFSWCRRAGFTHTETIPLNEATSAAVAYK
jgi:2-polyprenyl-3-methyl-5-hydroxy-6-metoxy-1,4-benzoquinol methylase